LTASRQREFYPTPGWVTRALVDHEKFIGDIWECACGNGAMSKVLKAGGNQVHSSDLYDWGYGLPGVDFVQSQRKINNIVTNPPFSLAEQFAAVGLRLAQRKLALFLRLAFLEGQGRAARLFSVNPPTRVWVFSERPTLYYEGARYTSHGKMAFAWFVWEKGATQETTLHWFPLGYRDQYGIEGTRGLEAVVSLNKEEKDLLFEKLDMGVEDKTVYYPNLFVASRREPFLIAYQSEEGPHHSHNYLGLEKLVDDVDAGVLDDFWVVWFVEGSLKKTEFRRGSDWGREALLHVPSVSVKGGDPFLWSVRETGKIVQPLDRKYLAKITDTKGNLW